MKPKTLCAFCGRYISSKFYHSKQVVRSPFAGTYHNTCFALMLEGVDQSMASRLHLRTRDQITLTE